jgi:hypothetical protein
VLCSFLWQRVRCLVVLFAAAFYSGHAIGQPPTRCAPLSTTPVNDANATLVSATASETQIWKTITVGGSKGVNAVRVAMETAPCGIAIGDDADEILGRPAFPFIKTPVELDLVVLSVRELGFGDLASIHDIYARAVSLGFELCPAEVGPLLRLNYLDQPLSEFLHIAMKPVAKYNGELIDFTIGNGGNGLLLLGGDARPDMTAPGSVRFVFVRPRPDTIVSASHENNGELAKR